MKKSVITIFVLGLIITIGCEIKTFSDGDKYMPHRSLPNIGEVEEFHPFVRRYQLRKMKIDFPSELPQIPSELMIYMKVNRKPTYEEMKKIGDIFGMGNDCEVEKTPRDGQYYAKKGYGIEFRGSARDFEFTDYIVKAVEGKSLPNEEEGRKIAEAYLRDKGLWLEGLVEALDFSCVTSISKNKMEMTVKYEIYKISDNPIVGSVYVDIIPGPLIKGILHFISEFQSYKLVKTITPKEAIERICDGNAFLFIEDGNPKQELKVNKCSLKYQVVRSGINSEAIYLQPLYCFEGKTVEGVSFVIQVSAVDDYYLRS